MKVAGRLARPAELVLGFVFLFAAVLKALDVNQFAVQIYGYGLIDEADKWMLGPLAVLTIGLEAFLGCAMLLGIRFAMIVLTAAQGMLIVFTCFILYGWWFYDLKDCGCFGGFFHLGPAPTVAKNLVLLMIGGVAWLGFIQGGRGTAASAGRIFGKTIAALILTALITAYSYSTLQAPPPPPPPGPDVNPALTAETGASVSPSTPGAFAGFVIEGEGQTYRLAEGEHLVALLSMTCDHCMASVPILNSYVYMPDLPPLVGLGYEETPGSLEEFKAMTAPEFPIHSLGDQLIHFFSLIGKEPPRLTYVVNGHAVHHWDYDMPTPEDILAVTQGASPVGEAPVEAAEPALTE